MMGRLHGYAQHEELAHNNVAESRLKLHDNVDDDLMIN